MQTAGASDGCHANLAAGDVQKWCIENGADPKLRIVLAGYDDEHHVLVSHGWREVPWFKSGFLKGGMGNLNNGEHQQHRERLWLSPACIRPEQDLASELQGLFS